MFPDKALDRGNVYKYRLWECTWYLSIIGNYSGETWSQTNQSDRKRQLREREVAENLSKYCELILIRDKLNEERHRHRMKRREGAFRSWNKTLTWFDTKLWLYYLTHTTDGFRVSPIELKRSGSLKYTESRSSDPTVLIEISSGLEVTLKSSSSSLSTKSLWPRTRITRLEIVKNHNPSDKTKLWNKSAKNGEFPRNHN